MVLLYSFFDYGNLVEDLMSSEDPWSFEDLRSSTNVLLKYEKEMEK